MFFLFQGIEKFETAVQHVQGKTLSGEASRTCYFQFPFSQYVFANICRLFKIQANKYVCEISLGSEIFLLSYFLTVFGKVI